MKRYSKGTYIILFGRNKLECLSLIIWGVIRRVNLLVITLLRPTVDISRLIHYIGRVVKSVREYEVRLDRHKGLLYEVNRETIDLTVRFYNEEIKKKSKLISYYNKLLNTNKFEAYIKKELSCDIFDLLMNLYAIRLSPDLKDIGILVSKGPLNEFIVDYMEDKYNITYKKRWVRIAYNPVLLVMYYGWFIVECIRRGCIINRHRQTYKIAKEVMLGFQDKTHRDDLVIDNDKFKTEDMLLLKFIDINESVPQRLQAFKEAKKRGFNIADVSRLKININKDFFNVIFFYIYVPLKAYFSLFLKRQSYFFYYIFLFHKRCFPITILMNLYDIRCYISTKDWDDVEETIILNKYGTKTIIFHWSDLTFYKAYAFSFVAHNIYFTWGDIHYDYQLTDSFVDEKINIGCIFKEEYNRAAKNKEAVVSRIPNLNPARKTVVFYDTSFNYYLPYTKHFFLEYLEMIKEFAGLNRNINVVLKPKRSEERVLPKLNDCFGQYKRIKEELTDLDNFLYLNPFQWSFEEIIAVSDVVVGMGASSPSTVALICGKNALYFDTTGNVYYPFAKRYKNILVFDNKDLLFKQIRNILEGRFDYRDVIRQEEIRQYDAFDDDRAIERLRNHLYELTKKDSEHVQKDIYSPIQAR